MSPKKNILIVDDDAAARFINKKIVELLLAGNAIIYEASNGENALTSIERNYAKEGKLPDFILLDLDMSVMSGIEFLEKFQSLKFSNKEKAKIIVVSASTGQDTRIMVNSFEYDFVEKPLTVDKLRSSLR